MKYGILAAALVGVMSMSAYAEHTIKTYPVKSVNGVVFEVEESVLLAAAEAVRAGSTVNLGIANEDGSVTFESPRFLYNGVYMQISDQGDSVAGYCADRKYIHRIDYTAITTEQPGVVLTVRGKYDGTASGGRTSLLTSVTCMGKLSQ